METRSEAVVVSIFGRGHWLASELAALGLNTVLIDLSEQFGHWAPEDWEGPFGVFQSDVLPPSYVTRLHEEDYFDTVDEGFTVWLKNGPVDFLGPHANYLLEKARLSADQQVYLHKYDQMTPKDIAKAKTGYRQKPFSETWLLNLAHVLGSNTHFASSEGIESNRPLPVFGAHSIRRVSRKGFERSLDWVASKNVKVLKRAKIRDFSIVGKSVQSLEIESPDWSGAILSDQFSWALSSAETSHVLKKALTEFFSGVSVEAGWSWLRYRFRLESSKMLFAVPKRFVMIEDVNLSWTHSNLSIVQKTSLENEIDVWVKIPSAHRFHKEYIVKIQKELEAQLASRIPGSQPTLTSLPQEAQYDGATLGPSRVPVYEERELKSVQRKNFSNLHFGGPEMWELLDWNGQYGQQKEILESIRSWKIERDQKRAKLEAQAESRRARRGNKEE